MRTYIQGVSAQQAAERAKVPSPWTPLTKINDSTVGHATGQVEMTGGPDPRIKCGPVVGSSVHVFETKPSIRIRTLAIDAGESGAGTWNLITGSNQMCAFMPDHAVFCGIHENASGAGTPEVRAKWETIVHFDGLVHVKLDLERLVSNVTIKNLILEWEFLGENGKYLLAPMAYNALNLETSATLMTSTLSRGTVGQTDPEPGLLSNYNFTHPVTGVASSRGAFLSDQMLGLHIGSTDADSAGSLWRKNGPSTMDGSNRSTVLPAVGFGDGTMGHYWYCENDADWRTPGNTAAPSIAMRPRFRVYRDAPIDLAGVSAWVPSTIYVTGWPNTEPSLVKHDDGSGMKAYRCAVANSDATFIASKWKRAGTTICRVDIIGTSLHYRPLNRSVSVTDLMPDALHFEWFWQGMPSKPDTFNWRRFRLVPRFTVGQDYYPPAEDAALLAGAGIHRRMSTRRMTQLAVNSIDWTRTGVIAHQKKLWDDLVENAVGAPTTYGGFIWQKHVNPARVLKCGNAFNAFPNTVPISISAETMTELATLAGGLTTRLRRYVLDGGVARSAHPASTPNNKARWVMFPYQRPQLESIPSPAGGAATVAWTRQDEELTRLAVEEAYHAMSEIRSKTFDCIYYDNTKVLHDVHPRIAGGWMGRYGTGGDGVSPLIQFPAGVTITSETVGSTMPVPPPAAPPTPPGAPTAGDIHFVRWTNRALAYKFWGTGRWSVLKNAGPVDNWGREFSHYDMQGMRKRAIELYQTHLQTGTIAIYHCSQGEIVPAYLHFCHMFLLGEELNRRIVGVNPYSANVPSYYWDAIKIMGGCRPIFQMQFGRNVVLGVTNTLATVGEVNDFLTIANTKETQVYPSIFGVAGGTTLQQCYEAVADWWDAGGTWRA